MKTSLAAGGRRGVPVHNANDPTSDAMKLWNPANLTFDDSFLPERDELVAKSDDAIRNNPMLAGGVRTQIDQTIGDHYRMSYNVDPKVFSAMGMSPLQVADLIDNIEDTFNCDAQSDENWFDASGRMSLTDICGCGMYTYYRQGEVVQIGEFRETQRKKGNRPFATAVSLINPDRVMTPWLVMEDRFNKAGFKFNKKGYAYGMYVMNTHPMEYVSTYVKQKLFSYIPRHYPWGRARWLHLMNNEASDQSRGRSSLIGALKKERMLSKFEDVMLSNAITRAFYAAVVESDDPTTAFEGLEMNESATDLQMNAILQNTKSRAAYYGGENGLLLNDSAIAHLHSGDHLKLLTPDGDVSYMDPFVAVFMRHLARSLDISYEEFTGDYTKTNFSGARAGKIQGEAGRRSLAAKVPSKQARFIATAWLEEMFSLGRVPGLPGRTSRLRMNNYLNQKESICQFDFNGPGIGHIDPTKGTTAAMNELKMGALTLEKYCNTYHNTSARKVLRQRAQEIELAKSLDIDLERWLGVGEEPQEEPPDEPGFNPDNP